MMTGLGLYFFGGEWPALQHLAGPAIQVGSLIITGQSLAVVVTAVILAIVSCRSGSGEQSTERRCAPPRSIVSERAWSESRPSFSGRLSFALAA